MGLLDRFRKRNKNPPVDEKGAHYHSSLDYLSGREDINCPECAAHQKHVKLKKTEGEEMECPECHYIHMVRR